MKKLPIFILFSLFTFCSSGCDEEECTDALADLTAEVLVETIVNIQAGDKVNVPNLIKNILDASITCLTDTAGPSESRMKIDYDVNGNSSYSENKINDNFVVPSIPAGMEAKENYEYKFNTPGEYRLITFADDKGNVKERDDNNNASTPDITLVGKSNMTIKKALIITVLPNSNFVKPKGSPDVALLRRTVVIRNQ